MQSRINAYLNFPGTAREAMEFYKSIFGGTLTISTFKFQSLRNESFFL